MTLLDSTQFVVIRHGETQWNAEQRLQGHGDSPLTPCGLKQAQQLARRLRTVTLDTLISSDLERARQTATIIAEATGHTIDTDHRLRERNYGALEGMTLSEIKQHYPEIIHRLTDNDPDCPIPGGESYRQFYRRCAGYFQVLAREHEGRTIAVVAHGGVLDVLFRMVTGLAKNAPRCFASPNAGLNMIRHRRNRRSSDWLIETWGEISHLTGQP